MTDEKIRDAIHSIRKRYKTEIDSKQEDPQQSFLDELNELIRMIFQDKSTDIYTTLNEEALEKWKKNRWRRFLKNISVRNILYFIFLVTIIGFLVSEAVTFYAIGGVVTTYAYVKAILTEVSFVFLNGFRSIGKWQMAAVGAMRVTVFALMLFVITSEVTFEGATTIGEIDSISQRIELLETQIGDAQKSLDFYRNKNWGGNAARVERERDQMRKELIELKKQQAAGKTEGVSDLIEYKTWGRAIFRVVLLLVSILITRRLFEF